MIMVMLNQKSRKLKIKKRNFSKFLRNSQIIKEVMIQDQKLKERKF